MELPTINLKELERLAIEAALGRAKGSVVKAARLLGIGRATLYRKMAKGQTVGLPPFNDREERDRG
jgi:transcriptional regulator of acetoin/glycerol metabolism